ncbi:MAG: hypothetical protein WBE76_28020 [Terracidiphilus sp.]
MPLYPNAAALIRANLETIQSGRKAKVVAIGTLTDVQLEAINRHRLEHNDSLPLIVAEVVFIGGHVYRSRIEGDNYTIDDVVEQIISAMNKDSALVGSLPMQAIQNPTPRTDRLGNTIYDRAVFECMSRHPRPELYSVIPKGDRIKPEKQKGHP